MEEKFEIKKMITIIILIVVIFVVFYGLTVLITKDKEQEKNNEPINYDDAVIDYDTILVKNIYNQSEDSYYVLATTSENSLNFDTYLDTYMQKENALKVYRIDLSSAFNKNYVSEQSNFENRFPIFNDSTLLKIENKAIAEKYIGRDEINTYLSVLNNEE